MAIIENKTDDDVIFSFSSMNAHNKINIKNAWILYWRTRTGDFIKNGDYLLEIIVKAEKDGVIKNYNNTIPFSGKEGYLEIIKEAGTISENFIEDGDTLYKIHQELNEKLKADIFPDIPDTNLREYLNQIEHGEEVNLIELSYHIRENYSKILREYNSYGQIPIAYCAKVFHKGLNIFQEAVEESDNQLKYRIDQITNQLKEMWKQRIKERIIYIEERTKERIIYKEVSDFKKLNTLIIDSIENESKKETSSHGYDKLRDGYPKSVEGYCNLILNDSNYPDCFPKSFELEYNPETKILIVDYSLPALEDLPTLKEVKTVKYKLKEYHASETQMQKIFENTMYCVTLRTIHELFSADKIDAIDAISFNGWVNAINKATGKKVNNCILSIQVKKSEFLDIDLRHVDPKICFKNLKGVGSSKLSGMTPIQPIMQISKIDKRFTSHYDVADKMDDSTNLAAMDWEDFEHLIREVFGKEFSSNGGEVKVTQASRDGGVDAIAFDPDPIRGGKIIIQAKRYTNTVGVSAVRDLYGTVMNEGANKGILVTTADYGPDAYEFVKGKPLTLMNGANLLYLLEKHGHRTKIDIAEARRLML